MSNYPEALWLNASPKFQRFAQPLLLQLSRYLSIGQWNYYQHPDEGSSLDVALILVHDYLKACDRPIHLIGHSTGGLLGLLYARQHPERVKSLTLLGVGVHPAVDWQAHYCNLLKLLPCSREVILAQMVHSLFGYQDRYNTKALLQLLKQDLDSSPSPHSLYQQVSIAPGGVLMPLLICGSEDDIIVDRNALQEWQSYLKESDSLWLCPQGHHFFHYFQPQKVRRQVLKFWKSFSSQEINVEPVSI